VATVELYDAKRIQYLLSARLAVLRCRLAPCGLARHPRGRAARRWALRREPTKTEPPTRRTICSLQFTSQRPRELHTVRARRDGDESRRRRPPPSAPGWPAVQPIVSLPDEDRPTRTIAIRRPRPRAQWRSNRTTTTECMFGERPLWFLCHFPPESKAKPRNLRVEIASNRRRTLAFVGPAWLKAHGEKIITVTIWRHDVFQTATQLVEAHN
jgi:hypothetical protein